MATIEKVAFSEPVPKLKKVAAYARVSSGKDEILHSLSAQVSAYSRMIQNHKGWQYVGVYADTAKTGTKDSRENFQRLMEDCRAENQHGHHQIHLALCTEHGNAALRHP